MIAGTSLLQWSTE